MTATPPNERLDTQFRPGLAEAEKRALLVQLRLLISTAQEAPFDNITNLATHALDVPLALVSLVTDQEQSFAGLTGTLPSPWHEARATPLSHSFCQHVANSGKPLVVPDARVYPLVQHNLAVSDLNVIAYLGVPLRTSAGFVLGSLCAIDHRPRQWTERETETLRGLSGLVMAEVEMRLNRSQMQNTLAALQGEQAGRTDYARLLVHDLRTPLNGLLLGLRSIPLLGDLNPDQNEALEMALRGGNTLVSLVDDLLDTAAADERGADSLQITQGLDPARLLAEAARQVDILASDRKLSLRVEALGDQDGQTLAADEDKVVRALINLLSNAIKFTPAGGQVTLSACLDRERTGEQQMVFAVRDTGRGISPEDQAQLFQRFRSLEESRDYTVQRSSGLGLFFVKAVAEAHGGSVQVESQPGQGSTFSLILPCR